MSVENEVHKLESERVQSKNQLSVDKNRYIKNILNGMGEDIKENIDKPIVVIKRRNKIGNFFNRVCQILQKINLLK